MGSRASESSVTFHCISRRRASESPVTFRCISRRRASESPVTFRVPAADSLPPFRLPRASEASVTFHCISRRRASESPVTFHRVHPHRRYPPIQYEYVKKVIDSSHHPSHHLKFFACNAKNFLVRPNNAKHLLPNNSLPATSTG